MPKKSYTSESKKEIVLLFQSGKKVTDLAIKYGISKASIYKWVNAFINSGSFKTKNNRFNLETYSSLKQAMAQAKTYIKQEKAIYTVSKIMYIDANSQKKLIGRANLRTIIAQLKAEKVEFSPKYQTKLTKYLSKKIPKKIIYPSLEQAMAQAKADILKDDKKISTLLGITYFNPLYSEQKKKCLGWYMLELVIKDLETENPELFKKYQTNLTNYRTEALNKAVAHRKSKKAKKHNLTLEKAKIIIKTAANQTDPIQINNNAEMPLNMTTISAINQEKQQIGTGSSHFQLQPTLSTSEITINSEVKQKIQELQTFLYFIKNLNKELQPTLSTLITINNNTEIELEMFLQELDSMLPKTEKGTKAVSEKSTINNFF